MALLPRLKPSLRRAPLPPEPTYTAPPAYAPRMRARPARWKSTAAQRHIPPHICAHCFLPSARGVLPQGFCVYSAPHARREHRRTAPARLRLLPVPPRIRAMRKGQNTARARAASPQFHRPVLVLSPSEDIIHARPVIFRKANQRPDGNLALSLFISPVYLPLAVQDIGNLLLRFVVVDPQVLQSSKVHILPPHVYATILWHYKGIYATI